ncbi:SDR family oxidoreductase [Sphingobium phenoxybenzoativorans]|uniref:SDR family oxidoreductase n=1 Tax=Sphingobium phenoxybenzoativorans TaxID=1592790 RepID=A0A975K7D3_9SPHN|nr:SDR family oxidoreductase [Sphingobium phenoxybenzoativorans]QUT05734.1 SDR family oxidoreductase [Sphingobium phenoxybenzoativorans]
MKMSGNTILITGGGSGIGRALAHRLHDMGNHVIVAGRKLGALEQTIAGRERMAAITLDVEDSAAIKAFAAQVKAEHPGLNILINNAGIMRPENLTAARDLSDAEATVVTNLLGPIRLTDAFIDHLAAQEDAVIVNVSSALAFVPLPATPTYSATKAAIHFYTLALRQQLKGKVEVIELVPPGVQTELQPGQSKQEGFLPLDAFIDEVLGLLQRQPTPAEICVERAGFLRNAEAEGRFDKTLEMLSAL